MKSADPKKKLMTLSEVSLRADVSMPTLQKYLREHADDIPWVGEGRRRRYPDEAIEVVVELKKAGLEARGRSKSRSATMSSQVSGESHLLSLKKIQEMTGISYPTLLRYVRLYSDRLPSVGTGRARRYLPQAVPVFRELRSNSRKGGGSSSAETGRWGVRPPPVDGRLARLEKNQAVLQSELKELVRVLKRPMKVTLSR